MHRTFRLRHSAQLFVPSRIRFGGLSAATLDDGIAIDVEIITGALIKTNQARLIHCHVRRGRQWWRKLAQFRDGVLRVRPSRSRTSCFSNSDLSTLFERYLSLEAVILHIADQNAIVRAEDGGCLGVWVGWCDCGHVL